MHNTNSTMNKNSMLYSYHETVSRPEKSANLETNKLQNMTVINIEREIGCPE